MKRREKAGQDAGIAWSVVNDGPGPEITEDAE